MPPAPPAPARHRGRHAARLDRGADGHPRALKVGLANDGQVLVETKGGDKYMAADALRMLHDLNLTQQVSHAALTRHALEEFNAWQSCFWPNVCEECTQAQVAKRSCKPASYQLCSETKNLQI